MRSYILMIDADARATLKFQLFMYFSMEVSGDNDFIIIVRELVKPKRCVSDAPLSLSHVSHELRYDLALIGRLHRLIYTETRAATQTLSFDKISMLENSHHYNLHFTLQ